MNTPLWRVHGKGKQRLSVATFTSQPKKASKWWKKRRTKCTVAATVGQCLLPLSENLPSSPRWSVWELVGKVPKPVDGSLQPCPPGSSPILLHVLLLQPLKHSSRELHPESALEDVQASLGQSDLASLHPRVVADHATKPSRQHLGPPLPRRQVLQLEVENSKSPCGACATAAEYHTSCDAHPPVSVCSPGSLSLEEIAPHLLLCQHDHSTPQSIASTGSSSFHPSLYEPAMC